MLLQLNNISLSYGAKTIFHNLKLEFHDGDIVGIVGKNGVGKTTLLKLITKEIKTDTGTVSIFPNDLSIVYHEQFLTENNQNQTIESYGVSLYPNLHDLYNKINSFTDKNDEYSIKKIIEYQSAFEELGGYEILAKINECLSKLGLKDLSSEKFINQLSGGQKTRLQLMKLVLIDSDILLLDEPTNHLDSDGISWLKNYIANRNKITIIVSHDREFLNSVSNKILELETDKQTLYGGNYDSYLEQKNINENKEFLIYKSKMKQIDRLSALAGKKESEAKTTDKKFIRGVEGPYVRKRAGKKSKTAKILKDRIEKQIAKDMPDRPMKKDTIKFELKQIEKSGQLVCKIEDINFGINDKNIFHNFNLEIWQGDRIAVNGKNGSGKTTLLKIINQELKPESGSVKIGENVKIGYFSQEHEFLDERNTVIKEFQKYVDMPDEDSRTFLYFMLFSGNQVFQEINSLSEGEKSKLVLAILLTSGANFLILDEPTNHLDIASREVLEKALGQYDGTMIVVSHDEYFLERVYVNKVVNLLE